MSRAITHELKIYANAQHRMAQPGELILHLWFRGGNEEMKLDLDIALHRKDVAYVDLIDCVKETSKRLYPEGTDGAAAQKPKQSKRPLTPGAVRGRR